MHGEKKYAEKFQYAWINTGCCWTARETGCISYQSNVWIFL